MYRFTGSIKNKPLKGATQQKPIKVTEPGSKKYFGILVAVIPKLYKNIIFLHRQLKDVAELITL